MEEEGAELKFETTMMIICKHDLGWILLAAAAPIIIITTTTNVSWPGYVSAGSNSSIM